MIRIIRKMIQKECVKSVVMEFIREISIDRERKLIVAGKCCNIKTAVRLLKRAGMNCIEIHTEEDYKDYIERNKEINASQKIFYLLLSPDYKNWLATLKKYGVDRKNIVILSVW